MTSIVLPFKAISYNTYYRIFRNRYVISAAGREFRERVKNEVKCDCLMGDIKLEVVFSFKDRRKRDLDNCTKAIIDALKGIAYEDDSQITEFHAKKIIGKEESISLLISKI